MITEINNLVRRYKELIALDHFRLEVEEGEILGLLRPSGSGKTTVINCMLALLTYDRRDVRILGKQVKADSYDLKQQIGVVPQNVAVFHELSVEDNINYLCGLYISDRAKRRTFMDEAIRLVPLEELHKLRPGKLSGGLLRRLNIICGIAHRPKLIFMDEPATVVDPQSRSAILESIRRLGTQGVTIVYTSHYMEEVEETCSRIIITDKGKTIVASSREELKTDIMMRKKIEVGQMRLQGQQVQDIQDIASMFSVQYNASILQVEFTEGKRNLTDLLGYFTQESITYGKIYSQRPTLNDVFLEITGKQLRS